MMNMYQLTVIHEDSFWNNFTMFRSLLEILVMWWRCCHTSVAQKVVGGRQRRTGIPGPGRWRGPWIWWRWLLWFFLQSRWALWLGLYVVWEEQVFGILAMFCYYCWPVECSNSVIMWPRSLAERSKCHEIVSRLSVWNGVLPCIWPVPTKLMFPHDIPKVSVWNLVYSFPTGSP